MARQTDHWLKTMWTTVPTKGGRDLAGEDDNPSPRILSGIVKFVLFGLLVSAFVMSIVAIVRTEEHDCGDILKGRYVVDSTGFSVSYTETDKGIIASSARPFLSETGANEGGTISFDTRRILVSGTRTGSFFNEKFVIASKDGFSVSAHATYFDAASTLSSATSPGTISYLATATESSIAHATHVNITFFPDKTRTVLVYKKCE